MDFSLLETKRERVRQSGWGGGKKEAGKRAEGEDRGQTLGNPHEISCPSVSLRIRFAPSVSSLLNKCQKKTAFKSDYKNVLLVGSCNRH